MKPISLIASISLAVCQAGALYLPVGNDAEGSVLRRMIDEAHSRASPRYSPNSTPDNLGLVPRQNNGDLSPCAACNPVVEGKELSAECPPKYSIDQVGDCAGYINTAEDCTAFCQVRTQFHWGLESPFTNSDCRFPLTCSVSETHSTSWNWHINFTGKVGKAIKIGISGGYTSAHGESKGNSWGVQLKDGQCGYFTFVPVRKDVCGTLTESSMQKGLIDYCRDWLPEKMTTGNWCVSESFKCGDRPEGVVIFVYTDCYTRKPLTKEFQDPIFQKDGVSLHPDKVQIIHRSWLENTCSWDGSKVVVEGNGFADEDLKDDASALQSKIATCGSVLNKRFVWHTDSGNRWNWRLELDMQGPLNKACVGEQLVSWGAPNRDQCV